MVRHAEHDAVPQCGPRLGRDSGAAMLCLAMEPSMLVLMLSDTWSA